MERKPKRRGPREKQSGAVEPYAEPLTKLTPMQRRFVDLYDGNAAKTAILAGYKSAAEGKRNLRNPLVLQAIEERRLRENRHFVMSRLELQEFWTSVVTDEKEKMRDRLKAAELLGKSEAMFVERVDVTSKGKSLAELIVESLSTPRKQASTIEGEVVVEALPK